MILELIVVYFATILSGGWAVASGVMIGINPFVVWLAAVAGSLTVMVLALTLGGRASDSLLERFGGAAEAQQKAKEKAGVIVDRWGYWGLGAVGPMIIGPTLTLLGALLLGLDRRRFALWYTLGTIVGFALLTLFWVAVV